MRVLPRLYGVLALCLLTVAPSPQAFADTVSLSAIRDATLYQDATGAIANGVGQHFFAGRTNPGLIMRGLIAFDIAGALPAEAVIESVVLTLNATTAPPTPRTVALHRVLAAWGEGNSNASGDELFGALVRSGDATWLHRLYQDFLWETAGGDFSPVPSAGQAVGAAGTITFQSTPALVAEVQGWLNNPASNHGWLLHGDETVPNTLVRFDTREHPAAAQRPLLTITYSFPIEEGEGDGEVDEGPCPLHPGFEDALTDFYERPAIGRDPETEDLDGNGILDIAHARLLDTLLFTPGLEAQCPVRDAYLANLVLIEAELDEVDPGTFNTVPRATLAVSFAGIMTLTEINGMNYVKALLQSLGRTIDLADFDASAGAYLSATSDADDDGVCNLGEFLAAPSIDAYVAAALNPEAVSGRSFCGDEGEIEGEAEVGGEGEGEPEGDGAADGEGAGEGLSDGEDEGEGERLDPERHTADVHYDSKINLSELLRGIQLFNSDGFHCAETEDGYAPGPGQRSFCFPHSSDYRPRDWRITLTELLRLVQFYNAGGYAYCPAAHTEDGYCALL